MPGGARPGIGGDMTEAHAADGPTGIGGWLILPVIGLAGTILLTIVNLFLAMRDVDGATVSLLSTDYKDVLVMMALSLIFGICLIAYAIYCLRLIFTQDSRTPARMVAFYIMLAAITVIEAGSLYHMANRFGQPDLAEGAGTDVLRAVVFCAIWIPYFKTSKRVRNTFGNNA
jgi:hypothetical protein